VERIRRRTGNLPGAVTADRGYGQPAVERDLYALGVPAVAIPRQATTSPARKAIEHSRSFHRLVKWRTGSEGRIIYSFCGQRSWPGLWWSASTREHAGTSLGWSGIG